MNNKHAYLIICSRNYHQIKLLIELLDSLNNDIYIIVDKKSKLNKNRLNFTAKYSQLSLLDSIKISWGGYSMVKAEIKLLKYAIQTPHDYYHLLSDSCLPIVPQSFILNFFKKNYKKEFIDFEEYPKTRYRYRYYHFLKEFTGKGYKNCGKNVIKSILLFSLQALNKLIIAIQCVLRIKRSKQISCFYKGSQWFSITENMARFIINQEDEIRKTYRFTVCPDESFIQTFARLSPYSKNIICDNLRFVNWDKQNKKLPSPMIFSSDDYNKIINSKKLYARKFDLNIDKEIVEKIVNSILKK